MKSRKLLASLISASMIMAYFPSFVNADEDSSDETDFLGALETVAESEENEPTELIESQEESLITSEDVLFDEESPIAESMVSNTDETVQSSITESLPSESEELDSSADLSESIVVEYDEIDDVMASGNMVPIDETTFPDLAFREYVLSNIDNNHDSCLSETEISNTTYLDCSGLGISDLTGINYLCAVRDLYCQNNKLTTLDISELSHIYMLVCSDNELTELDLEGMPSLQCLYCQGNEIEYLDFTHSSNIKYLGCDCNNISELDLSLCPQIVHLTCTMNDLISDPIIPVNWNDLYYYEIYPQKNNVPENFTYYRTGNNSVELAWNEVVGQSDIEYEIWVSNSRNGEYELYDTTSSTSLNCSSLESGTDYYYKIRAALADRGYTYFSEPLTVSVSEYSAIAINALNFPDVDFRNFIMEEIDDGDGFLSDKEIKNTKEMSLSGVGDTTGLSFFTSLESLELYGRIAYLNASGCESLIEILGRESAVSVVNLSGCSNLERCYYLYEVESADVSGCSSLRSLGFHCKKSFASLDLSDCASLESLACDMCGLTELDLRCCPNIKSISLPWSDVRSINVDGCMQIESINLGNSNIETLDLSNRLNLKSIYCPECNLNTINIDGCDMLETLDVSKNHLVELDVSSCTELQYLYCQSNDLYDLDLSNNTKLVELWCSSNYLVDEPVTSASTIYNYGQKTRPPVNVETYITSDGCLHVDWESDPGTEYYLKFCADGNLEYWMTGNTGSVTWKMAPYMDSFNDIDVYMYDKYDSEYATCFYQGTARVADIVLPKPEISVECRDLNYAFVYISRSDSNSDWSSDLSPSFELYVSDSVDGVYQKCFDGKTYNDINYCKYVELDCSREHYYKCRYYISSESGDKVVYSEFSDIFVSAAVAPGPSDLRAIDTSSSSIEFSWSPVEGADMYGIMLYCPASDRYRDYECDGTSFVCTDLLAYTDYEFTIRAYSYVNGKKTSMGGSSKITATTSDVAPQNVEAVPNSPTSITITWDPIDNVGGYEVYRATSENGPFSLISSNIKTTSITSSSFSPGTTYYFKVRTCNYSYVVHGYVYGSFSDIVLARTDSIATPSAPDGVAASALSPSSVKVSWNATGNASGYEVYRSTSETGTYVKVSSAVTATSLNDNSAQSLTRYYYKVRAYTSDPNGNKYYGPFSSVISTITKPETPTGLTANPSSNTTIDLSWNSVYKPSEGTIIYEIWRNTSTTGIGVCIGKYVGQSSVSKLLKPNTTYYYRVRAYWISPTNTRIYGDYSPWISAKTRMDLVAPSGIYVTGTDTGTLKVYWSKVEGAEGYEVFRATSANGTYVSLGRTTNLYMTNSVNRGTMYFYKVMAYNGDKNSVKSDAVAGLIPYTPTGLKVTKVTSSTIDLAWNKLTLDVSGRGQIFYEVFRLPSPTASRPYTCIGIYDQTRNFNTSYNLRTGTTYYYCIRAYYRYIDSNGVARRIYGDYSSIIKKTTKS
ncbi:MAG: fibronectin type III domain-containing protein [Clostridiales bacterium]|nr:fibronectin type III domain-containing protein [Clostridiales bacterium]